MSASPIATCRITTDRLLLRPTCGSDADRAIEIQTDWNVTRMLRMASFPPDRDEIGNWFANHQQEWIAGEAYQFAVERHGTLIGIVDVDDIANGEGALGYWFAQTSWGQGYALEASQAVVRFAFDVVGLSRLRAGHAADNPASGRVLIKLGFRPLGTAQVKSRSRGEDIVQCQYFLPRPQQPR